MNRARYRALKISGLTEIDSTFYISIGTNTLVNFILQALFWIILL